MTAQAPVNLDRLPAAVLRVRLDRLRAALAREQHTANVPVIGDGHDWRSPMVWAAAPAVPGPWPWLSAAPAHHQAAA